MLEGGSFFETKTLRELSNAHPWTVAGPASEGLILQDEQAFRLEDETIVPAWNR